MIPGELSRWTWPQAMALQSGVDQKFCAQGDDSYIGTYTHRSMMAQAARRKQGSSVALQVFQPCRVNNLQEEKEIFFSSVALRKNTGSGVPIQVYGKTGNVALHESVFSMEEMQPAISLRRCPSSPLLESRRL